MYFGSPYCSMKRSLIIITVSAETISSAPVPKVLRVPTATAKPSRSGSSRTEMVSEMLIALVATLRPERKPGPAPPTKW